MGSAAFNLLVISAVSIYAVSEESEGKKDPEEVDDSVDLGLKKINDLGVFGTTAIFSLWAYAWMWIVLGDMIVELWEAILTFLFVFLLLAIAYFMDRRNAANNEVSAEADIKKVKSAYSALEVYKTLLSAKSEKAASKEEQDK